MVVGMACKIVTFSGPRLPPCSPVLAQAAVALLRFFMGSKKGHGHLMLAQYVSNQGGHAHVARVKGQVNGLWALLRISWRLCSQGQRKRIEQECTQKDPGQTIAQSVIGVAHGPRSKPHAETCPL